MENHMKGGNALSFYGIVTPGLDLFLQTFNPFLLVSLPSIVSSRMFGVIPLCLRGNIPYAFFPLLIKLFAINISVNGHIIIHHLYHYLTTTQRPFGFSSEELV